MGVRSEQEALDYIPPAGSGTSLPNAAQSVAITGTSTTAQATGAPTGVIGVGGAYITFIFLPTTAPTTPTDTVHLRFGDASVGAAVVADMPLPPGIYVSWWCGPGMSHFRAIQTTTGGILYWWKSNQ